MKLVFLYGPPAAGKLTVANELSALTGFKLIDRWDLFSPIPFRGSLTIDTSLIPPDEAAAQIAAHFSLPRAPCCSGAGSIEPPTGAA